MINQSTNQSINQSLLVAVSKYSVAIVNSQLWTGQWGQGTNHCL